MVSLFKMTLPEGEPSRRQEGEEECEEQLVDYGLSFHHTLMPTKVLSSNDQEDDVVEITSLVPGLEAIGVNVEVPIDPFEKLHTQIEKNFA